MNDVWDNLFKQFGDPHAFKVWEKFNTGEYTAAQCIAEACTTVEGSDATAMDNSFTSEPLRPGFVEFIEFCRTQNIKITIVSDGFSIYIRSIFSHHGIDLPYFTNTVELTERGMLTAEFPHARES